MEKRSTVCKSKSSNSAIFSSIYRGDKKSSSNNEIKPPLMKKRGVYVEKKIKPDTDRVPQKPPKRSRPEQKKFLASVLSILSKSTTETQYPEKDNSNKLKLRSTQKTETQEKNRKTKYKSTVLNNELKEDEDIFVLKSKKNIISQSPSIFSDRSTDGFKWSEVSQNELNKNSMKLVLENNVSQGLDESAVKDVLKAPKCKKKLRIQDESSSEINPDKKIYNFFVDLLESIFNIYDVKKGAECETIDSKTRLEVDESVAQKLLIKKESLLTDQKSYYTNEMDTEKNSFLYSFMNIPPDVKISEQKLPKVRPKITKSNPYTRKQNSIKSKSFNIPKDIFNRKPQKLLDILKEQLARDVFTFEEPQNLYQALKIMAKNKRKCKKTIHYNENNKFERFDKKECMFRRKVLFKSKKKSRKPDPKIPKLGSRSFEMNSNKKIPSYHSLDIYGYDYGYNYSYDYEEPVERHIEKLVKKKHSIWLDIHSPSSISETDLYCSTLEFEVAV